MDKRIEWIDALRGSAMWLVVLGHTFFDRSHPVRNYVYSFHMPLFFFISGLTYKRTEISFLKFLKKKAKAFLLPYLAINIFVAIIKYILHFTTNLYANLSLKSMVSGMLTGDGENAPCIQSWFLLTLFLTEIIFYCLDRLMRGETGLFIASVIVAALGWVYSKVWCFGPLWWHLDVAFLAVLFFWFGYFFKNNLVDKIEQLSMVWKWVLCVVAFIIGAILSTINGKVSMNGSYYGRIYFFLLAAFCSILGFTFLSMAVLRKTRFINTVGRNTMFYLGYHAFFTTIFKTFFPMLCRVWYLTIPVSIVCLFLVYFPAKYGTKYVPILVGKWWPSSEIGE
ncbi:MAG: acyltransferase family protein [Lachnospiraceae bacterium]|nr:acyltransferase family protein [Lachnospiraceae bacterium]